jgi:TP901 family phage tail tape measure protein
MSEVVAEYKVKVGSAVSDLDAAAKAWQKVDDASNKATKTASDGFVKGSDGAKRLNAELQKQPKTLAELELKLQKLRELLRDDTEIGTKGFKQVTAEIQKTQQAIDKANVGLKQTGGAVTNLGTKFKALGVQVLAALGVTGLIFGLVNAFKSAVGIATEFEAQMSTVAAISGASSSQVERLTMAAKQLGATTKFTATEVGQLQEELARLGFTTDEILAATEATLNLAAATGSTLAESAMVAGSTVRGFGLDASETTRVTDVMALSFSKSGLSMDNFAESMKLVAPIARAANIPVETTVALLGKLADSGLKGSLAGTSLKNLLSKLSDANSNLSKSLGFAVTDTESLFKALNKLKDSNIDLTEATELTDERSKAAFMTLLNGIDTIEDLKIALDGAKGSAAEMSRVMQDNLQGDVTRLTSAWEGLILAMSNTNTARVATQILTQLIDDLNITVQKFRGTYGNNQLQKEIADAMSLGNEQATSTIKNIEAVVSSEDQRAKNVKMNLTFVESLYDKEQAKIKVLSDEYDSIAAGRTLNAMKRRGEIRKQISDIDVESERLLSQIEIYAKYIEKVEESTNAEQANNKELMSGIRNIAFLNAEMERLKKEQEDVNKSRVENIATSIELKRVEEERAILLGKETEAQKEAKKAAEDKAAAAKKALEDELKANEDYVNQRAKIEAELNKILNEIQDELAVTSNQILDRETQKIKENADVRKKILFDALSEQIIDQKEFDQGLTDIDAATKIKLEEAEREHQLRIRQLNQETNDYITESNELTEKEKYDVAILTLNAIGDAASMITNRIIMGHEQELRSLQEQLDNEEITREEFDNKRRKLERRKASDAKALAIFTAVINTATAVLSALNTVPFLPLGPIMAGIAGALGAVQIGVIASQPLPAFKDGVIGLKGKGTGTSDEIDAKLSNGESVMTAAETKKYNAELWAIRKGTFENLIIAKYVKPMIDESLFKGMGDIGKSAELNGLTANLKDHNIIAGLDRLRQSQTYGFKFLAKELKQGRNQKRGGYNA